MVLNLASHSRGNSGCVLPSDMSQHRGEVGENGHFCSGLSPPWCPVMHLVPVQSCRRALFQLCPLLHPQRPSASFIITSGNPGQRNYMGQEEKGTLMDFGIHFSNINFQIRYCKRSKKIRNLSSLHISFCTGIMLL